MTLAAIDIGTNSVKLLIGRVDGREVTPLLHRMQVTRLGEGVDLSGRISAAAADRTIAALKEFRGLARERGAVAVSAAGTQVFRAASNAAEVIARVRREAEIEVRVSVLPHEELRSLLERELALLRRELDLATPP